MRQIAFIILCVCLATAANVYADYVPKVKLPAAELRMLDDALANSKKYDKAKLVVIDSMQKELSQVPTKNLLKRWQLNMAIGDQYRVFSTDSAHSYYQKSLVLAESTRVDSLILHSKIARLNALSAAGIFTEAVLSLDSLKHYPMSSSLRIELMKSGRQLYSYMLSYVNDHSQYYQKYYREYKQYDDSLINLLPRNSSYYRFIYAEHLIQEGKYKDAKAILEKLLGELPDYSNLYGMCAYQMADAFYNQGDEAQYARYLALSAICDIKGSVKETLSLPTLAQWLYEQGEVDRAYNYINASLRDAMTGNARMRAVAIARFVPMIDNAYRQKINSSRDELMIYFMLVTVLLLASAVLFFYLLRHIKRLRDAQRKLAATSKVQDNYIGNFLGLCSSYADKLESMSKLVSRKIAAGQTDELLKLIKSGKFTEEQNDDFYKIFDNAFLDLYPDFVDEINKLLREEEQMTIKKGAGLPTELRIYAFVRLGVEESTRISQILHYSVSTIYTYRNRMRNKAINRDTFDEDVMRIGREF